MINIQTKQLWKEGRTWRKRKAKSKNSSGICSQLPGWVILHVASQAATWKPAKGNSLYRSNILLSNFHNPACLAYAISSHKSKLTNWNKIYSQKKSHKEKSFVIICLLIMSAEFNLPLKLSAQIKTPFLKIIFNLYLEISPYWFHKRFLKLFSVF